jgi:hypothetical protein
MNDFNYHFSDNGSAAAFNNVGIGTNCGLLNARLQVQNPVMNSGILVNTTTAGIAQNFGLRGNAQNAIFKSHGVAGYAINLGPVFNAGVYGEASNAIQSNYGGEFKAYGPSSTNTGVLANANSGVSANYGVLANANGGLAAFGVFGQASSAIINYAIYGNATGGTGINYAGYFNGDVVRTGTDNFTSDINLKENIDSVYNAITIINQLKPKTFTYKNTSFPSMNLPTGMQYGLIAQEVETIMPELVNENVHPAVYDSTGAVIHAAVNFKSLEYQQLIPLLLKGIQEQQRTISDLNTRLTNLENCISNLNLCDGSHAASPSTNDAASSQQVNLKDLQAVILDQNVPNPFAEQTTITYTLIENTQKAQMLFYNAAGKLIHSVELATKAGKGELNVFGNDLSNGIYTYTLVVDGKIIDTKRMVKNK